MDDRATIRVPAEQKSQLDKLKEEYRASSISAVIERLMQDRKTLQERMQRMRESQEANMIDVGQDRKEALTAIQKELGLRSEADTLDLLVTHYRNSSDFHKETLIHYGQLLRNVHI